MLKKILVAGAVFLVVLLAIIAMQPKDYQVSRTATMAAEPAVIFDQINDFHKWIAWSPWQKLDPNAKNTFEGPSAGKGAIFKWEGNSQIGQGQMTLKESKPNERILIDLEFIKPMAGKSLTEFTFKPVTGGTEVTWSMSGENNFVGKAICLVMNMDKAVGPAFKEGLDSIKKIVEAAPPAARPPTP